MNEPPIQTTGTAVAALGGRATSGVAMSLAVIADLHQRQADIYAGGPLSPLADLLADDVVWHLAGGSPIAGEYRGWEAVLQYFATGRELAAGTMRVRPEEVVAANRDTVIQLVGERASVAGETLSWRAAGFYRVERGRVRGAWLVPLDPELFDRAWAALGRDANSERCPDRD
jgi:ketosteroid isomerase-like protein